MSQRQSWPSEDHLARMAVFFAQKKNISLDAARRLREVAASVKVPASVYAHADVESFIAMGEDDARRYLLALSRYLPEKDAYLDVIANPWPPKYLCDHRPP